MKKKYYIQMPYIKMRSLKKLKVTMDIMQIIVLKIPKRKKRIMLRHDLILNRLNKHKRVLLLVKPEIHFHQMIIQIQ